MSGSSTPVQYLPGTASRLERNETRDCHSSRVWFDQAIEPANQGHAAEKGYFFLVGLAATVVGREEGVCCLSKVHVSPKVCSDEWTVSIIILWFFFVGDCLFLPEGRHPPMNRFRLNFFYHLICLPSEGTGRGLAALRCPAGEA